jgi:hypothetical protein
MPLETPLHHCNAAALQAAGKVVAFAELPGVLVRLSP